MMFILVGVACLASGCRTFNWTEKDTVKERQNYEKESKGPLLGGILGWFIPTDKGSD